jgi:hypothetical protein
MSDPRRLRERAAGGLDRALLESAREDRAAAGAEERALAALGLGAVAATGLAALAAHGASAPKAAAVASKVASAVLLKWLGIGVVATVAVSAPVTYLVVSRAERAATVAPAASGGPPQARAARTPPPSAPPARLARLPGASDESAEERATESAAEAPAIAVSALADAPAPAPTTPAPAPTTPAPAPTAPASAPPTPAPAPPTPAPAQRVSSLSPEVDVLDRARHALAAHDPVAARAALDEYQRRFPKGSLREEAELAAIESLVLSGDSAGTREAAARFLAAHPDSAYAGRVRAIVKRAPNP